ncbi:DNA mismatch repair protein MutT [Adhaeribacter aerolatus]|uniref:DNA mismatch repair protein MutT n=1 Tax=Adhaeribacter aerolatus TaxID=670289 RepID=A0A512B2X9_9BACT|nr:NUDIX domain-containing protein [Adhaeribacter aerolatus]GEO06318.1 DNA mismatch repair protein MutT [Adhaeribacter aerolatus]
MDYRPEDILPSISTDNIIFGLDNRKLKVLLIRRNIEPLAGSWALPGGFVLYNEDLDMSARRTLQNMTGMSNVYMEQVYTFGAVNRFPDRRVVTVAYYALINYTLENLKAGPDATDINWFDILELPELVFDHQHILDTTLEFLRAKVRTEPIGFELLPQKFTLTELQGLYEAVLGTVFDTRNFRKKILKMNLLMPLDETQVGVAHRAARLYSFNKETYHKLKDKGFTFEL